MPRKTPGILLLDRDQARSRFMEKGLSQAGFSVVTRPDTTSGMALLASWDFHALIVDVMMTRLTDRDLIAWARSQSSKLLIVVVSDFRSSFLEKQCCAKGADLFVQQPVDLEKMIEFLSPPKTTAVFSGTIRGVDLKDYLQFVIMTGSDTVLEISDHGGTKGEIFVNKGNPVHAVCGELRGENALYRCLGFKKGWFSNLPWRDPQEVTINRPARFLLLEAARRHDDAYWAAGSSGE